MPKGPVGLLSIIAGFMSMPGSMEAIDESGEERGVR